MSSKFETALKNTLSEEISVTENGAVGYAHSQNPLLDINFATSSLRNKSEAEITKMFSDAFYFDPLMTIKWLFFCRDVRSGMGERRTFRICLSWLANTRPELVCRLITLISEFGRWDDLFCLIDSDYSHHSAHLAEKFDTTAAAIKAIDDQWTSDFQNMKAGKSISLLAKWMPSVSTSSRKTVALARFFCKELSLSEKQYRKTLSAMRKYLNVVEQKMSAKQWNEIDYEKVPSMANVRYKNAFLKNDKDRRTEYLTKLSSGEAKINSTACFPSDIVHAYSKTVVYSQYKVDSALEAMWKSLPSVELDGNIICCCDGSGSMQRVVDPKSSVTALEVCDALGIYCSEHLTGPFKDKYITFSSRPQYVDLSKAKSLAEKLSIARRYDECANTNIEATLDLMLKTAVDNKLKQEDIPTLVIMSDLEFDQMVVFGPSVDSSWNKPSNYDAKKLALFENMKKRWNEAGYKLPKIVFWNIASRSNTVPMQENELGVILCSGYSQTQFKMLQSNKIDPYEALVEALNVERYAPVEAAIKDLV